MIIAFKVANSGLWGGNPERVLNGRVDYVLAALDYKKFLNDYEEIFIEMNKGK
jgi:hypothetical protein